MGRDNRSIGSVTATNPITLTTTLNGQVSEEKPLVAETQEIEKKPAHQGSDNPTIEQHEFSEEKRHGLSGAQFTPRAHGEEETIQTPAPETQKLGSRYTEEGSTESLDDSAPIIDTLG